MSIAEETKQQLMFLADTYAAAALNLAKTGQHSDEARAALSAALADLTAERDALAKDAARYRWIREGDGDNQVMTYVVGLDDWTPWSCPEDVDAAIDTALKLGL